MRYHLYKASRLYEGRPYCGPSSNSQPAEANSLNAARDLQQQLNKINPVGWRIRDTLTGQDVDQHKKS